jgi:hypothetical protein
MISMIQKAAPGRLARAILALAARSGKKIGQVLEPDHIDKSHERLPKRTIITVETETLMIVRSERRISSSSWEADDLPRGPLMTTRAETLATILKHWLHAACSLRSAAADEKKTKL